MKIRILPTPPLVATALADVLVDAIRKQPSAVLGLPTGHTPIQLYRELAARCAAGCVSFSQVTTFNLDEFVGLGGDDARSYRRFMHRYLFDHVNVSSRRVHVLDGAAADLAGECRRYERAIVRAGGIDLMILGLGINGHIGFNEPAATLVARTHVATLSAATRRANAGLFDGRLARVPREGITMGMATILNARRIVLVATGAGKARAAAGAIAGPLTTRLPASFLQLHADCEVWLDGAAATMVRDR